MQDRPIKREASKVKKPRKKATLLDSSKVHEGTQFRQTPEDAKIAIQDF